MKKTILGLMPLLVASMLIAGCGKKAESSAPASSSEAPASSSEAKVHSQEEIEADIEAAASEATKSTITFTKKTGYDIIALAASDPDNPDPTTYPDTAEESVLKPVVKLLMTWMPAYLGEGSEYFWNGVGDDDYWGDGSTIYTCDYANEDESVEIQLQSYCYNGVLGGYIIVQPAE